MRDAYLNLFLISMVLSVGPSSDRSDPPFDPWCSFREISESTKVDHSKFLQFLSSYVPVVATSAV